MEKRKIPPPLPARRTSEKAAVTVQFTSDEVRIIEEGRKAWAAAQGGKKLWFVPEVINLIDSLSLYEFACSHIAAAKHKRAPLDRRIRNLLAAKVILAKTYAVYNLPFYIGVFAAVHELLGESEEAERIYEKYLQCHRTDDELTLDRMALDFLRPYSHLIPLPAV